MQCEEVALLDVFPHVEESGVDQGCSVEPQLVNLVHNQKRVGDTLCGQELGHMWDELCELFEAVPKGDDDAEVMPPYAVKVLFWHHGVMASSADVASGFVVAMAPLTTVSTSQASCGLPSECDDGSDGYGNAQNQQKEDSSRGTPHGEYGTALYTTMS